MLTKQLFGVLAILLLFIERSDATTNNRNERQEKRVYTTKSVCYARECLEIAALFHKSMNKSADPCVNFYEYACGGWGSGQAAKPKYERNWDRFAQFNSFSEQSLRVQLERWPNSEDIPLFNLMKKWYRSCMHTDAREKTRLDPIVEILQKTRGWPMVLNKWDESTIQWQEIDEYYREFGAYTFYRIDYSIMKSSRSVKILVPVFPLHKEINILPITCFAKDDEISYRIIIKEVAKIFIRMHHSNVMGEKLTEDINELIKFELSLCKAATASNANATRMYRKEMGNKRHLAEFTKWWNDGINSSEASAQAKINWTHVVQGPFQAGNFTVHDNPVITPKEIGYLIHLRLLLQSTDKRTIVNYIQWKFLSRLLEQTTDEIKDIFFKIRSKKYNVEEKLPHWVQCIRDMKVISRNMNDAISYMYIKKHYSISMQRAVLEIIQNIKESLKFHIHNSSWLSIQSKRKMIEKVNSLKSEVGHPDWWRNETAFVDQYNGWSVDKQYLQNILNVMKLETRMKLRNYAELLERSTWPISPLTTDAVYRIRENVITIPAAMIQPLLFGVRVPEYVHYGLVGNMIAHEMGHAFDREGIHHSNGYFAELLDERMLKIYNERAECLMRIYDSYLRRDNAYGLLCNLNGNSTSITSGNSSHNENIADWIDILVSFHAYQERKIKMKLNNEFGLPSFDGFTDEKMFFISWAQLWCDTLEAPKCFDSHLPANIRVLGSLANNRQFAQVFNCPENSAVNPQEKCDLIG